MEINPGGGLMAWDSILWPGFGRYKVGLDVFYVYVWSCSYSRTLAYTLHLRGVGDFKDLVELMYDAELVYQLFFIYTSPRLGARGVHIAIGISPISSRGSCPRQRFP
jgi:hypothetical protein